MEGSLPHHKGCGCELPLCDVFHLHHIPRCSCPTPSTRLLHSQPGKSTDCSSDSDDIHLSTLRRYAHLCECVRGPFPGCLPDSSHCRLSTSPMLPIGNRLDMVSRSKSSPYASGQDHRTVAPQILPALRCNAPCICCLCRTSSSIPTNNSMEPTCNLYGRDQHECAIDN